MKKTKLIKVVCLILCFFLFSGCELTEETITDTSVSTITEESENQLSPTVLNTREDLSVLFNYDFSNSQLIDVRVINTFDIDSRWPWSEVGVIIKYEDSVCPSKTHALKNDVEELCCECRLEQKTDEYIREKDSKVYIFGENFGEYFVEEYITHFDSYSWGYVAPYKGSSMGHCTLVSWITMKFDEDMGLCEKDTEYMFMFVSRLATDIKIGDLRNEILKPN